MKKWLIGSLIAISFLSIGGYAGYHYLVDLAANKLLQELPSDLKDTDISIDVDKLTNNNDQLVATQSASEKANELKLDAAESKTENIPQEQNSTKQEEIKNSNAKNDSESREVLSFENKQQAVKFAMSKFSVSEIKHIKQLASGELTAEKKAELKRIAYSKFTKEEIEAVRKAVSK
ncbi:hypothetical protein P9314_11995 [Paenibacillus validus]|uniref:hypothetical protein n=1 Tax=Paenibacillus validus TaxID=44253 RepID=UPI000FDB8D71|nr:hypothetical protein [Paenibacillus validus]MED4601424.1 hypothetical protein [Paenibacillus validus]MED4608184.1 hypothetical protein [Paenibacillus validus]